MRAAMMYGAGDVWIETVPDAGLVETTDAVVRVTHAAICVAICGPTQQWSKRQRPVRGA
jgi:hypothetical protein